MKIERYTGRDSRSAMAQVRADLGADALILANRRVGGQVEITAAIDVEQAAAGEMHSQASSTPGRTSNPGESPRNDLQLKALEHELTRLQGILEKELGDRRWQDSAGHRAPQAALRQRLLRMGLSRTLGGALLDCVPAQARLEQGWRLALSELSDRLAVRGLRSGATPPEATALYGGTGVGKTSTVARLAARDAQRLGVDSVGLITLDCYRVGAREQLASFASAIGIPLRAAHDSRSLSRALRQLRGRRVYIDTAGMSQHDARLRGQFELIASLGTPVQHLLVLAASAQASQCRALAASFGRRTLSGAIISKVDEAQTLGGVLDVVVNAQLPLMGFSDGQRIPEDLHEADPRELVRRAAALVEGDDALATSGKLRSFG